MATRPSAVSPWAAWRNVSCAMRPVPSSWSDSLAKRLPKRVPRSVVDTATRYRFFAGTGEVGKRRTQQLERKHLTLRTRIKRLVRKTICFSKSIQMHEIVIGLFINRCEFGVQV
jgi:IS1 family transposase